jgi:DNA-binding Lrp family transcriptional regulator
MTPLAIEILTHLQGDDPMSAQQLADERNLVRRQMNETRLPEDRERLLSAGEVLAELRRLAESGRVELVGLKWAWRPEVVRQPVEKQTLMF